MHFDENSHGIVGDCRGSQRIGRAQQRIAQATDCHRGLQRDSRDYKRTTRDSKGIAEDCNVIAGITRG